jgi:uncharacterized membrane protein YbaN (DUF454 family)
MSLTAKSSLFIIAGTFFLVVGAVGIFVPVLPTTPFLLLAAACYARGSHRMYHWLLNNRVFGIYIKNYLEGRGMPLKLKALTIFILWLGIGLTIVFGVQHWALRTALVLIGAGVSIHIILISARPLLKK